MGSTDGPHSVVTQDIVQLTVEKLTGNPYCPVCPPPAKQPPLEPANPGKVIPGLRCEIYDGRFFLVSHFAGRPPVKTVPCANVDLSPSPRGSQYGLVFTGFLEVPADGVYRFHLRSDDGSRLFLGDRRVANNDGLHGMIAGRGDIHLRKGLHPIRVEYFQFDKAAGLELRWEGPNIPKALIPNTRFFRTP
jgi:hypothetical protein